MERKQALIWTGFWVLLAAIADGYIYYSMGIDRAVEFGNAYIMEKLLSFDNLFVFLLIFNHFNIKSKQQRKILNYGIIGAIVLRGLCIFSGMELINNFKWLVYGLGLVLVYSSYKIFTTNDDDDGIENSSIVKWCSSANISIFMATLISIELSDIIFAVDSIPVVLAITSSTMIAYSSNLFAIMGLRSLYFVMTSFSGYIEKMSHGIGIVLGFIGIKMLLTDFIHVPSIISLLITILILGTNALIINYNEEE